MSEPHRVLSFQDVRTLHAIAIEDRGDDPALRDPGLLDSAVATPQQRFGGQYTHEDIPAMAAAYAFHICRNHPFVDGNKRAGIAAMIAFLSNNGWRFTVNAEGGDRVTRDMTSGQLNKADRTAWVRAHASPRTDEQPGTDADQ